MRKTEWYIYGGLLARSYNISSQDHFWRSQERCRRANALHATHKGVTKYLTINLSPSACIMPPQILMCLHRSQTYLHRSHHPDNACAACLYEFFFLYCKSWNLLQTVLLSSALASNAMDPRLQSSCIIDNRALSHTVKLSIIGWSATIMFRLRPSALWFNFFPEAKILRICNYISLDTLDWFSSPRSGGLDMQLTYNSVEILFFLRIVNHGDDLSWISHPHMMSSPLLYNSFLKYYRT